MFKVQNMSKTATRNSGRNLTHEAVESKLGKDTSHIRHVCGLSRNNSPEQPGPSYLHHHRQVRPLSSCPLLLSTIRKSENGPDFRDVKASSQNSECKKSQKSEYETKPQDRDSRCPKDAHF